MKTVFVIALLAIPFAAQTTRTVCASGCDHTTINAAIDASSCGDTIVPTAGETFTEDVILDHKGCSSTYITIQSSALGSLPAAGNRVAPSDASNMPTIRSTTAASGNAIATVSGANPTGYYRLIGLNILRHNSTAQQVAVVSLGTTGTSQDSIDEMPHNIIIDRCLIRGADNAATRRGIRLDAKDVQVINSYLDNFWEAGTDSQAILGINGGQNVLIANNFLEGASENVMFGGGDPSITNFVPNNITIEHNHFFKRLAWVGASKVVKNLFELKSARDVTVRNNIFENHWVDAQSGYSIVFTPRNQDGGATWTTLENVTFEYNIVRNVSAGFNILTKDDINTSEAISNFDINNNLFTIYWDAEGQGGAARTLLIQGASSDPMVGLTIDHNTFIHIETGQYKNAFTESDTAENFISGLSITNNIIAGLGTDVDDYLGLPRGSLASGAAQLARIAVDDTYTFTGNVIQRSSSGMPPANDYVANNAAVGFVNYATGDYELDVTSDFKGQAPGGLDPGVNWDELIARTDEVEAGTNYSGEAPAGSGGLILGGSVRLRGIRLN